MPSSVCLSTSCIVTHDVSAVSSGMEAKVSRLVLLLYVKSTVVCQCSVCFSASCILTFDVDATSSGKEALLLCV